MYFKINCGFAAINNGAHAPLSTMFAIAKAADAPLIAGGRYGDDYIEAPTDPAERQALLEMIEEAKLPYALVERVGEDKPWIFPGNGPRIS